jgi:hypothetical protein
VEEAATDFSSNDEHIDHQVDHVYEEQEHAAEVDGETRFAADDENIAVESYASDPSFSMNGGSECSFDVVSVEPQVDSDFTQTLETALPDVHGAFVPVTSLEFSPVTEETPETAVATLATPAIAVAVKGECLAPISRYWLERIVVNFRAGDNRDLIVQKIR